MRGAVKSFALVLATVNAPYSQQLTAQELADCLIDHDKARAMPGHMSSFFAEVAPEMRQFVSQMTVPYCGHHAVYESQAWFGEAAPHLKSFALVELRRDTLHFGAIALGSEDPKRFYPEMGTLYLKRLGELTGVARAVLQQVGDPELRGEPECAGVVVADTHPIQHQHGGKGRHGYTPQPFDIAS